MTERVECDACKRHDAPCHDPARCPCWCGPHKGRACNGSPCTCFPKDRGRVQVLTGTGIGAMDWQPAA